MTRSSMGFCPSSGVSFGSSSSTVSTIGSVESFSVGNCIGDGVSPSSVSPFSVSPGSCSWISGRCSSGTLNGLEVRLIVGNTTSSPSESRLDLIKICSGIAPASVSNLRLFSPSLASRTRDLCMKKIPCRFPTDFYPVSDRLESRPSY